MKNLIKMIDFTKYDTSYELQSIQLMIDILKPYILFKKSSEEDIQIYQMIEGKENKKLTVNEYIRYIQIIFPNIIHGEIETLHERNRIETVKKEVIDSRRSNGEFKLPLFLGTTNDKSLYEFFIDEFNQMDNNGLLELKKYYKGPDYNENKRLINEKYIYYEKISKFNRSKNGTIRDVIQFLDNLKYYPLYNA